MRSLRAAAIGVVFLAACAPNSAVAPPPALVVEIPGAKGEPTDIAVIDLTGRELVHHATGSSEPLPVLHSETAQVAYWREGATGGHELVVWNIPTRATTVVFRSEESPAVTPSWSDDGAELAVLTTTVPLSTPFDGKAQISVVTVATGAERTLDLDRPFVPGIAGRGTLAGHTLSEDRAWIVVDTRSGRVTREVRVEGAEALMGTPNPDVMIAMREAVPPGSPEVTLTAVDARTGVEINNLGELLLAGPMPTWPGRSEFLFLDGSDLKAYDYVANRVRSVGRVEGLSAVLTFDPLGEVLLVFRNTEPYFGVLTVQGDRLSTDVRPIPTSARAMGFIRERL